MTDSWQKNPIIVAAATFASTAALFMTVFVPIIEKNNLNKITDLENLNKEQTHSSETLKEENENLKKQALIFQTLAEEYKNEDRFSSDTPYPKGLRKIKIFQDYNSIGTAHPDADFNENTIYTHIKISDTLFKSAAYYPTKCNNKRIIKEIRYLYKDAFTTYMELRDKNNDGALSLKLPTDEEIKNSEVSIKKSLIEIFKQKYKEGKEDEDGDYIVTTSETTLAIIADGYLSIASTYSEEEISEACSTLLSCPADDNTTSSTNKINDVQPAN